MLRTSPTGRAVASMRSRSAVRAVRCGQCAVALIHEYACYACNVAACVSFVVEQSLLFGNFDNDGESGRRKTESLLRRTRFYRHCELSQHEYSHGQAQSSSKNGRRCKWCSLSLRRTTVTFSKLVVYHKFDRVSEYIVRKHSFMKLYITIPWAIRHSHSQNPVIFL